MAGRTLMFTVSILSLRDATDEEVQTGVVGGICCYGWWMLWWWRKPFSRWRGCGSGGWLGGKTSPDHDHGHSHGGGCGTGGGHGGCGCH